MIYEEICAGIIISILFGIIVWLHLKIGKEANEIIK